VAQPTVTCFATPRAPSTPDRAVASTDGAELPQLTAETGACRAVTTAPSLPLSRPRPPPSPRLVRPLLGMMVVVVRTSTEPLVMPKVLMAVVAHLTGKLLNNEIIVASLTLQTDTAEPQMATASSPTDARTAARIAPQSLMLLLRLPLRALPPLLALVSPSLASLHLLSAQSQLVFPLLMEAAVPSLVTLFAATGPRDLAAPCTDTVVTPLPTVVRVARTVLATRLPASPLLPPALLLLR
jgi:hypothetical protein